LDGPASIEASIRADGAVVVHVEGEVDASVDERLADVILLGGSGLDVVVDMSGVTFLDSTGLRALIRAKRACDVLDRRFVVIAPSTVVRRVFEIAGVDGFLTIVD
jgi:anti-sigma B factor antagonist